MRIEEIIVVPPFQRKPPVRYYLPGTPGRILPVFLDPHPSKAVLAPASFQVMFFKLQLVPWASDNLPINFFLLELARSSDYFLQPRNLIDTM